MESGVLPVPGPTAKSRAEHPKSSTRHKEPLECSRSSGDGLSWCFGIPGAPPSSAGHPPQARGPLTHRHGVSGDVVPLAVLDHLLQVWAVVGFSICDDNHYSLCPFPATFPKRFRAASEEMPWAAPWGLRRPTEPAPRGPWGRRPLGRCRNPRETIADVGVPAFCRKEALIQQNWARGWIWSWPAEFWPWPLGSFPVRENFFTQLSKIPLF